MDLFSRRIVGWSMSDKLTAKLSISALQDALNRRGDVAGLMHHDDYRTRSQARSVIFEYIEIFYNQERRHSAISYMSPVSYEIWLLPTELAS